MTAPVPVTPEVVAVSSTINEAPWYAKYAKFIPSALSVILAIALSFANGDSTVARVIQAGLLVLGSLGVVVVPNNDLIGALKTLTQHRLTAVKTSALPALAQPQKPEGV